MAGLFDKVVVGLTNGVNNVTEGSKLVVEKARINTQIQDIEREKNGILMSMGNLVYNLTINGEIRVAQCDAMCVEIKACLDKIAELQNQLQVLETQRAQTTQTGYSQPNGVRCDCGFVNKPTAKFCAGCGKPIQ